ncbi:hypothetical protein E4T47_07757 [Aureobasidium subglaciale]|nr:hypothetical protein E4T47_07757 [Aureobasidium subglaciale]
MSLEVTPLTEADIDAYIRVYWNAFTAVEGNLESVFFPEGLTEPVREYLRSGFDLSDPSFSYILVRDSSTKTVLSVAGWYHQTKHLTAQEILDKEEKARKERAEQKPVPGVNFTAVSDLREVQTKTRREILGGKPHALLKLLATDPTAQRRGAGAAALRWGLEKADDLGLPVYLEGSVMGRYLYTKNGFKDIREFLIDTAKYGRPHTVPHWCMLREAKHMDQ